MNFKIVVLLITLAALAGCATTPPMSLTKQEQVDIGTFNGILFIPQSSLLVTVAPTNAAGAGFIGVLVAAGIDAARRSSAETDAASILAQVKDYDFRTVMSKNSDAELLKVEKVKLNAPLKVEIVNSDTQKRIDFDDSTANSVLFLDVSYQLQSGNLYVNASAVMFPKSKNLLQYRKKPDDLNPLSPGNAIYRKQFNFGKQNVTADQIKDGLTEGATSIASQLSDDLNHGL
jgi:hypothetical protein